MDERDKLLKYIDNKQKIYVANSGLRFAEINGKLFIDMPTKEIDGNFKEDICDYLARIDDDAEEEISRALEKELRQIMEEDHKYHNQVKNN